MEIVTPSVFSLSILLFISLPSFKFQRFLCLLYRPCWKPCLISMPWWYLLSHCSSDLPIPYISSFGSTAFAVDIGLIVSLIVPQPSFLWLLIFCSLDLFKILLRFYLTWEGLEPLPSVLCGLTNSHSTAFHIYYI